MTRHLRSAHHVTTESHKSNLASGSGSGSSHRGGYQTQLPAYMNQSGGGTHFHYTHENMVEHMATFVVDSENSFTFAQILIINV